SLTITATTDSKVYGNSTTSTNSVSYNSSGVALATTGYAVVGLVSGTGDAVGVVNLSSSGGVVTATVNNGVAYVIIPSVASGNPANIGLNNYAITYINGSMTVTPKVLNVTIANQAMVYGSSLLPSLTYTTSGLINGDTTNVTVVTIATPYNGSSGSASSVGSYPITATALSNPNYVINSSSAPAAILTVIRANLTISALDQSSSYGAAYVLSQATNQFNAVGLVNGDYVSSATILTNVSQTGQGGSNSQTVSGSINAGTYVGNLLISSASGASNLANNYNITYQAGNLIVNKTTLIASVISDGKFVSQTDVQGSASNCGTGCVGGYAGVSFSGFKNSDSANSGALTGTLTISRSDIGNDTLGTHAGVLQAGGLTSNNYEILFQPANYTISPANQLVVKVGLVSSVYGTAQNYSGATAAYFVYDANQNPVYLNNLPVTVSGNVITVNDNLGTSAQFNLTPSSVAPNSILSSSGNINIGNYNIVNQIAKGISVTNQTTTGGNFTNGLVVMGMVNVTPKVLSFADLGISGVTKVYDGSIAMNNLTLTTGAGAFVSGDAVQAKATGTFSTQNVGTGLGYTVGVSFSGSGTDAANYSVTGGAVYVASGDGSGSGVNGPANGSITQLSSVTYSGPNGGNWSNPANWTTTGTSNTGAVPTQSSFGPSGGTPNVANVIIPVGTNVIYDAAVGMPVTSSALDNGNLTFNLPGATSIGMPISGSGIVTVSNTATLTLTGNNSYTGGTILNAGSSLIAGSSNAIAGGSIQSFGGSFATTGVTLPALTSTGPLTLLSSISTIGSQSYGNLTLGASVTLNSQNTNINFLGSIDGAIAKTQALTVNAGTGTVTLGDSISSVTPINSLNITGGKIYILADVLTATSQQYTGSVFIGDASYLGRTATAGWLFNDYRPYFEYTRGTLTSSIKYLNTNPIYVRTLISIDPSITFAGAVNDVTSNTHTLLVAAISQNLADAAINPPAIAFNQPVGAYQPLYSLNAQTAINQTSVPASSSSQYVGSITLVGGANTYSDQTYSTAGMTASALATGGQVTFSVYDPGSAITFMLPTHASSGGASQLNLYNGNMASLAINGPTNYAGNPNTGTASDQWSAPVLGDALGYVAPPNAPTVLVRATYVPGVDGAMLREAIDYHADQVQMTVDARLMSGVVSVSSPEEVALAARSTVTSSTKKGNTLVNKAGSTTICSADEKGETNCGED
ncbi:hypothetical protein IEN92_07485, partial [Polynucleobacter sp. MWH-Creno-3A4]|uniref:beta strand repeat-containing protein n=1 Tax=Polynucleobacter sp. MWH-Creno-3A4 TaxID=1855886 RepID=UPI001C0E07D5